MDKAMKVAVVLSAIDNMSNVVDGAVNRSVSSLNRINTAVNSFALLETGKQALNAIEGTVDAYAKLQEAGNMFKTSIMTKGGAFDEVMYKKMEVAAQGLSDKYANSAAAYLNMYRILKNNRISESDILGGIGEASAQLADLFNQMDPARTAEFAARLRNDVGVGTGEMVKMMDLVQRLNAIGVGKTGEEAVEEMNQFFSKVGLGMANLHATGLKEAQSMGVLGAMFMTRGISGQSVGTNFRRILDGMRDPEKMQKSLEMAKQFGVTMQFFDKEHKFLGIENMVHQLGKLQGLSADHISEILKPFSGKQGLSTDFLEYMANYGLKVYDEYNEKVQNQANLTEKLGVVMGGLEYKKKVFDSSWENTKAVIGEQLEPVLNRFYDVLNKIAIVIRSFVEEHPQLTKMILVLTGLTGIIAVLGGSVYFIKILIGAFEMLDAVILANPIGLVAAAFIAAAILIYSYWDDLPVWFKNLLDIIGDVFAGTWHFLDTYFFTPLISSIEFVVEKLEWMYDKIEPFMNWGTGMMKDFFGVEFNGSKGHESESATDRFSRAWSGAMEKMNFGDLAQYGTNGQLAPVPINTSGDKIVFNPQYTINGSSDSTQLAELLKNENEKSFKQMMEQYNQQQSRTRYSYRRE